MGEMNILSVRVTLGFAQHTIEDQRTDNLSGFEGKGERQRGMMHGSLEEGTTSLSLEVGIILVMRK
jgi:hypothetical protein